MRHLVPAVVLARRTFYHRRTYHIHAVLPPKFRTRRRRKATTPLRRCLTTFCPLPTKKSGDFSSWISIGVLRRIKYFSSFSLHPNQQQPSRRRKPKSIDAMVLLPSISVENYSVRLHCMELGMRKTSTTSPSSIAVISTVSESLFGNWDANKNLVVKYTTP